MRKPLENVVFSVIAAAVAGHSKDPYLMSVLLVVLGSGAFLYCRLLASEEKGNIWYKENILKYFSSTDPES